MIIERAGKGTNWAPELSTALTQFEAIEHTKQYAAQYPDVIIPFGGIRLDDPDVINKIERIFFNGAIFSGGGRSWPRATPRRGARAFQKMIFATDEGPGSLESNIERFERFLSANNVPETVREERWEGTMAKILGVTPRADIRP